LNNQQVPWKGEIEAKEQPEIRDAGEEFDGDEEDTSVLRG